MIRGKKKLDKKTYKTKDGKKVKFIPCDDFSQTFINSRSNRKSEMNASFRDKRVQKEIDNLRRKK
jgi:hypothetical protein